MDLVSGKEPYGIITYDARVNANASGVVDTSDGTAIAATDTVTVLATAREPLRLDGEQRTARAADDRQQAGQSETLHGA